MTVFFNSGKYSSSNPSERLNNSLLQYHEWRKLFSDIPVAVNNFYGDPLIQWDNTVEKLMYLLSQEHTGIVSIITKGKFTPSKLEFFKSLQDQGLRILVCVSVSELPQFEKVKMEHRYHNFKLLNQYGIKNVAFVRPMTPPYNTEPETIHKIVNNLSANSCKDVILSGFRGDDGLVKDMSPSDKVAWTMRVKLLTPDVYTEFKECCKKAGMNLFMRVACGVAHVMGEDHPLNPYYNSPLLCKCDDLDCPLKDTCKRPLAPKVGSLELLEYLGFKARLDYMDCDNYCNCTPDHRLECKSCCTTCFNLKTPRITILNEGINLGSLTFCRYLTGMLCAQDGVNDDGDKNVGYATIPKFPQIKNLACLNSWWSYAQHGKKCFDCSYCVDKYYQARNNDMTPLDFFYDVVENKRLCIPSVRTGA